MLHKHSSTQCYCSAATAILASLLLLFLSQVAEATATATSTSTSTITSSKIVPRRQQAAAAATVHRDSLWTIENDFVSFQFKGSNGDLMSITDKSSNVDVVGFAAGAVPVLSFAVVGTKGELQLESLSTGGQFSGHALRENVSSTLTLQWSQLKLMDGSTNVGTAEVSLSFELADDATTASVGYSLTVLESTEPIGMWDVFVAMPLSVGSDEAGELFYPAGFGYTYSNPIKSTGGNHDRTYPGGETSMQFLALGNAKKTTAAYLAAIDPLGTPKRLVFATTPGTQAQAQSVDKSTKTKATGGGGLFHRRRQDDSSSSAKPLPWSPSSAPAATALSIVVYVPDAGVPMTPGVPFVAPYKLAMGVLSNVDAGEGRPLWTEAATLYRKWALSEAAWTRQGPISDPRRSHQVPEWYTNNNVWLNTHWQCHDIFNVTGGDPHFVLDYTVQVADRLKEKSLCLHWYEWQQGPDPAPEARYLFDTHYPDYFPARTDFKSAVHSLAQRNISTFPYINGRISDINSNSYLKENGELYCAKEAPVRILDPKHPLDLTPYVETYGSNATFCVTNPFTAYWQDKTADLVRELVVDNDVLGVYIDQIGSAAPKLCFDSSHHHKLGGGSWWNEGYRRMMEAVQERIQSVARTSPRPMVTEDNAEPYMSMVQGYLTLNAFKAWYSTEVANNAVGTVTVTPAFPFIYGGYYVGFGAIWTRADFGDADWWCTKLATMFTVGSQLGWFSLAGLANDPEDGCGPMGVGDLIMDPANDALVGYLQSVSQARSQFIDYFVHGSVTRPPVLLPVPPVQTFTSSFDQSQQQYSTVLMHAWTLAAPSSQKPRVVVALAGSTQSEYKGRLTVDLTAWGFFEPETVTAKTTVFTTAPAATSTIKTKMDRSGGKAGIEVFVPPRSVLMIEFMAA